MEVRDGTEVEIKLKTEVLLRFRAMAEELFHVRGLALKLLRELELRITQTEAEKQTGRKQQVISKWEGGLQVPSRNSVKGYVKRLGSTLERFGYYHALALTMLYGSDVKMEIAFRGRVLRLREGIDESRSMPGIDSDGYEETLETLEIGIMNNLREIRRMERKFNVKGNAEVVRSG